MAETGFKKWIITITVILAALLELIDTTVVNVSLNDIMGNLGATLEDVAWVITAYAVANVIIVPMTGWLSAKFGRKNYFTFSILLFTIASFFCGHATSIWELVAFRFIQGIGGGALLSTSQAILLETFKKEEAGMANALFGLGVVVGPTIGPTLGGYLTDHFGWPWIFFVNIPLGALAAFMTITFVKDSIHQMKVGKNDWVGIFLLVVGVGSLQTVLERGQSEDWFSTPYITILAFVAVISIICFFWWELTVEHPVVNLRVLKNRSLFIGTFFTFILGFGLFSSVFVFPIFCQQLLGFTAQQTGLILMPGSFATICMMPFVGILMKKKFPPQIMAGAGFILFFISTWLLSKSNLQSGESDFLIPLIVRGLGLSLLFVPLTTLALAPLPPRDIAQGAGLNNMVRQLGGSFGVALMTTYIASRVAFHRMDALGHINQFTNATQERLSILTSGFQSKGFSIDVAKQMAYKALDGAVSRQAALLSYMDAFFVVGVFFLVCVPLLILQRTPKNAPAGLEAAH
jgi:DHA2 family multidrug resistance protein